MKFRQRILGIAALALYQSMPAMASAASPAAKVTLVTGRGTASAVTGEIRAIAKGDPIYSGEIIHSSANSFIDLKFNDGGYFLLRPNSRFEVVDFVNHGTTAQPLAVASKPAAPAPTAPTQTTAPIPSLAPLVIAPQDVQSGTSRAFFRLLKGGFRSISGLIGKVNHDEYQVNTPVATIGIRGTDYLVAICDESCAIDPEIAAVLPPGVNPLGGMVSTVYEHSIVITDAGGSVTLLEGQYLLVLPNGTNILLPLEPHFLRVNPSPNPANCAG